MRFERARRVGAMTGLIVLAVAVSLPAQGIEVAPFGGYRFGGEFVDAGAAVRPTVTESGPAFGVVFDVPLGDGLQFEGLFSHQGSDVLVATDAFGAPARFRSAVDHYQAGALQEYGEGRVRPFLTGVLGLSRYAIEADNEIRFTVGGGGGVKLFPASHFGVRLDGRVFATLLNADAHTVICGSGGCVLFLHVDVGWQAEFTAAMVVKLGPSGTHALRRSSSNGNR